MHINIKIQITFNIDEHKYEVHTNNTNQTIRQHRHQKFKSNYDATQFQNMHINKTCNTKRVHIQNKTSHNQRQDQDAQSQ